MCNCIYCNKPISEERLEALPETETCFKHSNVKKYISFVSGTATGKGSSLEFYKGNNKLVKNFLSLRKGSTL
jgi:hypothetical protein